MQHVAKADVGTRFNPHPPNKKNYRFGYVVCRAKKYIGQIRFAAWLGRFARHWFWVQTHGWGTDKNCSLQTEWVTDNTWRVSVRQAKRNVTHWGKEMQLLLFKRFSGWEKWTCTVIQYLLSFQTEDDQTPDFTYRVDGTGVFTITADGFVALAVDDLDFETTKEIKFQVSSHSICLKPWTLAWMPKVVLSLTCRPAVPALLVLVEMGERIKTEAV